MTWHENLEDFGKKLEPDSTFRFECHPKLTCFGVCCSTEITLTPYDIARMRRHLSVGTGEFLSRYCKVYTDSRTGFPFVVLKRKEDSRCIFLGNNGCSLYESRPSCCRNYPLARVIENDDNSDKRISMYYLQQEAKYCMGLGRGADRTMGEYCEINGLIPYEEANDLFLDIPFAYKLLSHSVRNNKDVQSMVFEAVFNFDTFFEKYGGFNHVPAPKDDHEMIVLVRSIALNLIKKAAQLKLGAQP